MAEDSKMMKKAVRKLILRRFMYGLFRMLIVWVPGRTELSSEMKRLLGEFHKRLVDSALELSARIVCEER